MPELPYDAILVLSFGGPEKHDDVIPFLENVLRGRNVPRERMLAVAEHYYHFDGKSPINEQNRNLIAALKKELAELKKSAEQKKESAELEKRVPGSQASTVTSGGQPVEVKQGTSGTATATATTSTPTPAGHSSTGKK